MAFCFGLGSGQLEKKTWPQLPQNLSPQWSRDTAGRILCFDRCQLTITCMFNTKDLRFKPRLRVSINLLAGVWPPCCVTLVLVVVRTRSRAKPLAMISMRISIHGFSFCFLYEYGAPLEGSSAIKKWNLSAGVVWAEQKCQVSYSNLLRSSRVIVVFSANKQNLIHKICPLVARLFAAGLRFSGSMWVNSRESETTRALWTRMGWS